MMAFGKMVIDLFSNFFIIEARDGLADFLRDARAYQA